MSYHSDLCLPSPAFKDPYGGLAAKNMPAMQESWVQSLGQEYPLGKETITHSSILAWEIHEQRSLVGYSPRGCKESDTIEHIHFLHSLLGQWPYLIHPIMPRASVVAEMVKESACNVGDLSLSLGQEDLLE